MYKMNHITQLYTCLTQALIPTIDKGLYHSASNPFVSSVVSHWDPSSYT